MAKAQTKKLYIHDDVIEKGNKKELKPSSLNKRNYYYEQLLIYGSGLPQIKSVSGKAKGWFRLPLGGGSNGKDKYLWFTSGEKSYGKKIGLNNNEILIRSIRDHDDTKYDLQPGAKTKWSSLDLKGINSDKENYQALTDKQNQIVTSSSNTTIVEGFPGTGKTIALLKKSDNYKNKKQIYLTYSNYLGSRANIWFEAKQDIIKDRSVYTFNDFLMEFTKVNKLSFNVSEKIHNNHLEAEAEFNNFIASQKMNLESWGNKEDKKNNTAVYHELYSKAFGLYDKNLETQKETIFENYKKREQELKKVSKVPKTILNNIFRDKKESKLFPSLIAARELVNLFLKNELKIPQTLKNVEVVLVDEIQDLTEIECFLLLLYTKSLGDKTKIVIAGDESQTVKPSAFKWTAFNRILNSKAKIQTLENKKDNQSRFNLEKSLRAPTQIAKIIHSTQDLYRNIDKKARPSVKKYDSNVKERYGRVVYYSASNLEELSEISDAISKLPSAACIYPGGNIPNKYLNSAASELIYTTERVKGLDFGTVAIVDTGKYLQEIFRDIESAKANKRKLENLRTKIDRLRVAVSRPTDMLILLDISPTTAEIKKASMDKNTGYRSYVEKLFGNNNEAEIDEMFSIISSKDQLIEELSQNTSKEEFIIKKIEQISKSIYDNPKSVQNETLSLLQISKKSFHEHEIENILYCSVHILTTVTFLNSILLSDKYDEYEDFRRIIDKSLDELAKGKYFKKALVHDLKILASKIEKFKTALVLKELDTENVQNLNSILKSSELLKNLALSGTSNLDVLNPSFERLLNRWFESLKEINTPDKKTISLIDVTITEFTKRFLENIKEKGIKKERKEVFRDSLKIIYKRWAEFSENSATGINKNEDLEKALDCYKILSNLSTNKDNIESVVRIMRRLNKHSDAENYLTSLEGKADLLDFEKLYDTIYSLKEIISSIEDFGRNNIFLEEEIDVINEKLTSKRSKNRGTN
jgi:hypothetical protein